MKPLRRRVLRFGLLLLLLLAALIPLYLVVWPAYQALVLGSANVVLAPVSPWTRIRTDPAGHWMLEFGGTSSKPAWYLAMTDGTFGRQLFLSLAVLAALLLATPARPFERLRMLGLGLLLLAGFHVLSISACTLAYGRLCRGDTGPFCANLVGTLIPGSEIAAVALWALIAWRHGFPGVDPGST